MSVFRKIFSSNTKTSEKKTDKKNQSSFLEAKQPPVDEVFTINFNKNGGKFLYCENIDEVHIFIDKIIEENNWSKKKALIINKDFKEKFKNLKPDLLEKTDTPDFLFTPCESLIANDGSILISSNQIAEKRLVELPENFIVFATTSQFVSTISEGLQGIKAKSKTKIPSNITTIKHFKANDTNNFLSYGSSTKNLYLLLLENL
tara:strand:- start:786 stop:1394 length:609 start_codon:yes stop_codon:yes gene_type:complete